MMRTKTVTVYTFDDEAEREAFLQERFPIREPNGEPGWYEIPGGSILVQMETVILYRRIAQPSLRELVDLLTAALDLDLFPDVEALEPEDPARLVFDPARIEWILKDASEVLGYVHEPA